MNIIFAVTRDAFKDYELLKNAIEGSSVGVLKLESDIINLVLEMYKVCNTQQNEELPTALLITTPQR